MSAQCWCFSCGVKVMSRNSFLRHGRKDPPDLPMFNLVWDIVPDLLHILTGIWKRHVFAMFTGKRTPAKVKPKKKNNDAQNAKLLLDHEKALQKLGDWSLSAATQEKLDARFQSLRPPSSPWISSPPAFRWRCV